jgi:hypothetical protein
MRPFTVYVDGRQYQAGITDEKGFFTIYFMPQRLGLHTVELVPEGYDGRPFSLEVEVKVSGRTMVRASGGV